MTLHGFSRDFLEALFDYSIVTGKVYRRVARSNRPAGEVVGTVDGKGYLHVSVGKRFIRLHQLALFLVAGEQPQQIDHANHARLCNAWHNLRPCTARFNAGNSGIHAHNTSGFRGVSRNTKSGKWHAQLKINGKQTYLGRRDTAEEAALLYNAAAVKHFGEFAHVNTF